MFIAEEHADRCGGETVRDLNPSATRSDALTGQDVRERCGRTLWKTYHRVSPLTSHEVVTGSRDRHGLARNAGDHPLFVVPARQGDGVRLE